MKKKKEETSMRCGRRTENGYTGSRITNPDTPLLSVLARLHIMQGCSTPTNQIDSFPHRSYADIHIQQTMKGNIEYARNVNASHASLVPVQTSSFQRSWCSKSPQMRWSSRPCHRPMPRCSTALPEAESVQFQFGRRKYARRRGKLRWREHLCGNYISTIASPASTTTLPDNYQKQSFEGSTIMTFPARNSNRYVHVNTN